MSRDVKLGIAIVIICLLVVMLGVGANAWRKNDVAQEGVRQWFAKVKGRAADGLHAGGGKPGAQAPEAVGSRALVDRLRAEPLVRPAPQAPATTEVPLGAVPAGRGAGGGGVRWEDAGGSTWEKSDEIECEKEITQRVQSHYGVQEEERITAAGEINQPEAEPVVSSPPAKQPSADAVPKPSGSQDTFYVVKSGDYLAKIAEKVYGDKRLWRRIYDSNRARFRGPKDYVIRPGMKLTIPPAGYSTARTFTPVVEKAKVRYYTVKRNDNLQKIAARFYRDPKKWRSIYEANAGKIKNPNVLMAGVEIRLPNE